jgi:excisionase family DNA binding protein
VNDKKAMTVADLARELGFGRSTVYRWLHLGMGPKTFRSPGGHIRILRSDFLEWQEKGTLPEGNE